MPKTPTDRYTLSGPTMGTRWAAQFYAAPGYDADTLRAALQAAVDEVDTQMTTFSATSDLMRMNRTPTGVWVELPSRLMTVLAAGVGIGQLTGGAFDIGMGDVVTAWGFGAEKADPERIRAALCAYRVPAHEVLELDREAGRARKLAPLALDLSGIAKGYGVDRLADTVREAGVDAALLAIDGELVGLGLQPDGEPWAVAVERPDPELRSPHSIIALHDGAIATSGDYRHWVDVGGMRLGHTMDPRRGGPLPASPASATVLAQSCMEADAFATALMVLGEDAGRVFAERHGLDALILTREGRGLRATGTGSIFAAAEVT